MQRDAWMKAGQGITHPWLHHLRGAIGPTAPANVDRLAKEPHVQLDYLAQRPRRSAADTIDLALRRQPQSEHFVGGVQISRTHIVDVNKLNPLLSGRHIERHGTLGGRIQ